MGSGLSIVLPTFNMGDVVRGSLVTLASAFEPFFDPVEFIVVDDGSTDESMTILSALARQDPRVRVVRNRRNLGKGMSVLMGTLASRHPNLLFTDADAPFTQESYGAVARELVGGTPVVIGSRRLDESQLLVRFNALRYATQRHVIGVMFNRFIRMFTGLPYTDTQCGLKAFHRDIALYLFRYVRNWDFMFDVDLLIAASFNEIPVREVPVCVVYEDSRSSMRMLQDGMRMTRSVLDAWMRIRRGKFRHPPPEMDWTRMGALAEEVTGAV